MELTKQDTQMAKGVAVLGMVMLHLFCRIEDLPYTPWIWVGDIPLIYYFGLFGDICVPIFCFCSGYAHYLLADTQKKVYAKRIPGKALRFLCNYWIVVILFSAVGLFADPSGTIPGNLAEFIGNLLLFDMSYSGAWWFVATYMFLLVFSPLLSAAARKSNWAWLLAASFSVYFVAYLFRFNYTMHFHNGMVQWLWNQAILFGTSQFPYMLGMVCRKYAVVSKLRTYCSGRLLLKRLILFGLPAAAFVGHGVVPSLFVAPFTACAILAALFLSKPTEKAERFLLLLGKHSTNIWLVHMFFYHNLFSGFVFCAKYPILILMLMLALCFAASTVIEHLYRPVCAVINRSNPPSNQHS